MNNKDARFYQRIIKIRISVVSPFILYTVDANQIWHMWQTDGEVAGKIKIHILRTSELKVQHVAAVSRDLQMLVNALSQSSGMVIAGEIVWLQTNKGLNVWIANLFWKSEQMCIQGEVRCLHSQKMTKLCSTVSLLEPSRNGRDRQSHIQTHTHSLRRSAKQIFTSGAGGE